MPPIISLMAIVHLVELKGGQWCYFIQYWTLLESTAAFLIKFSLSELFLIDS